ncbi:MAG: chromosomal replication initiator protein DnaA [Betaproteobacteria bacterium]|nr:chromosomal replication initiator protein DnaA [Betaproteobacteria bacterium]
MSSFWRSCLEYFQRELTPQEFTAWIKPIRCSRNDNIVLLEVPNRLALRWIKDTYLARVQHLADEHFDTPMNIAIELLPRQNNAVHDHAVGNAPRVDAAAVRPQPIADPSRLNPAYTFETFVTGRANQLARAAAIQVADSPGSSYNPLFIYGGVGLGKTHLLHAIGNLLRERTTNAKIRYLHAEQYVSDLVRAVQHRSFDQFKRYYQSLDLLLIDDIQFFADKDRTQEEFFYTFNALLESRRQIVITCDSFPKEITGMEDRLKTRFGWGLTVAVEPPDLEMRVAILLKKAELEGAGLDQPVAFFIAQQVQSNVRELEGALKRVLAFCRFSGQHLGVDTCKEALRDLIAVQSRQVTIDNIQRTVAEYYKIKVSEMYSKKRSRTIARPRQIAMALAKELTPLSLPDIGDAFGGRDHTTVLHACRKVKELRGTNSDITRDFNSLLQVLRN